MREETRKKFEREIRRQWLKRGAIAAACAALFAGALWFTDRDGHVERRAATGTIIYVAPVAGLNSQAIQTGVDVDVKLDDGRDVHVLAMKSTHPQVGEHVSITEHVHGTGRSTFTWK